MVRVVCGDIENGERGFDEALKFCTARGDAVDRGAVLINRCFLWDAKNRLDLALVDMQEATELARSTGQPMIEAAAAYNLAELTFWSGDDEEALRIARRAEILHARFLEPTPALAPLLLARISASLERPDDIEAALALASARGFSSDVERLLARATGNDDGADWEALIDEAKALQTEVTLEVIYWASRAAKRQGRNSDLAQLIGDAEILLPRSVIWKQRFADLSSTADLSPAG